ncbi:tetratricopeptide repeat protein [Cellvibrio sp. OA-2007]|uniref:tetratricopeptide repeat protein n=1 Tax=Cellvibrio sp. OA-2007 TaxID=529823 RepID=UPI0007816596|nr:tetratricopeptide repeat protein [Cellvibrio sp. OA-2007]
MVAEHNQHCEQTLMFTDIVGYSRLMGRNEAMAIEMLGDYRQILLSHIEQQGGQLVEFIGDAIFARFDFAASATAAAIAIQQHLQAFNEVRDKKLPPLQTRIGLHKGEVMLRDGAVFGDSVNIAARLEPLAVADGICLSQTVYDDVRFSLSSPAKRLGVQALKNIEQKIRVYLIKPSGIGWRDHLYYFLRGLNKKIHAYRYPLTACLFALIVAGFYFIPRWLVPGYAANYVEIADFQNLMNEKADADYFSAGITAAVRSQLADMRDVYIVDAKEGIHAPIRLEGSVQRLGDNLRISYRLFRRKDNVQIAGGKLDGTYQDIFILQDRLVGEIARYLAEEFDLQNFRPAPLRLTGDVTAYDYYLRGLDFLEKPASHENADGAIKNFSTALVHDANFPLANTGICEAYWKKYEITNSAKWLTRAEDYCSRSLSVDNKLSRSYIAISVIYRDTGRYEKAIEFLEKASNIDASDDLLKINLASVYAMMGKERIAEKIYLELLGRSPDNWRGYFGYGYFLTRIGRHEEAIANYKKVLKFLPENISAINNMAVGYSYLADYEAAARMFELASDIEPDIGVFTNIGSMYYSSGELKKAAAAYEKALELDPENYQLMSYLADAYKFIPGYKKKSDEIFGRVIDLAAREISVNRRVALPYQALARSYAYFGNIEMAKSMMLKSDQLDSISTDSLYSNLRIAVAEKNDEKIFRYARTLLNSEYSAKFLLADPDFSVLREEKYKELFFE